MVENAVLFAGAAGALLVLALFLRWIVFDAELRGKRAWLVGSVVLLTFPLGWLLWLLFRPAICEGDRREFDLEKFRVE